MLFKTLSYSNMKYCILLLFIINVNTKVIALENIEINCAIIEKNDKYDLKNYPEQLKALGKDDQVGKALDKATEIDPEIDPELESDAYGTKGINLINLDKYNQALELFNKIIELDPKNALAYYNKGSILSNIGRRKEAFECYIKAMKLDYEIINTYPNYN